MAYNEGNKFLGSDIYLTIRITLWLGNKFKSKKLEVWNWGKLGFRLILIVLPIFVFSISTIIVFFTPANANPLFLTSATQVSNLRN